MYKALKKQFSHFMRSVNSRQTEQTDSRSSFIGATIKVKMEIRRLVTFYFQCTKTTFYFIGSSYAVRSTGLHGLSWFLVADQVRFIFSLTRSNRIQYYSRRTGVLIMQSSLEKTFLFCPLILWQSVMLFPVFSLFGYRPPLGSDRVQLSLPQSSSGHDTNTVIHGQGSNQWATMAPWTLVFNQSKLVIRWHNLYIRVRF